MDECAVLGVAASDVLADDVKDKRVLMVLE